MCLFVCLFAQRCRAKRNYKVIENQYPRPPNQLSTQGCVPSCRVSVQIKQLQERNTLSQEDQLSKDQSRRVLINVKTTASVHVKKKKKKKKKNLTTSPTCNVSSGSPRATRPLKIEQRDVGGPDLRILGADAVSVPLKQSLHNRILVNLVPPTDILREIKTRNGRQGSSCASSTQPDGSVWRFCNPETNQKIHLDF